MAVFDDRWIEVGLGFTICIVEDDSSTDYHPAEVLSTELYNNMLRKIVFKSANIYNDPEEGWYVPIEFFRHVKNHMKEIPYLGVSHYQTQTLGDTQFNRWYRITALETEIDSSGAKIITAHLTETEFESSNSKLDNLLEFDYGI